MAGTQISIENGRLDESSTYNAKQATTDADGRFAFTPQIADYQLIVLHDQGYAHVKAKAADVLSPITLTPWATLTGVYKLGTSPQSEKTIIAGNGAMNEYGSEKPHITSSNEAVTQSDGRFRFDRLAEGRNSVQREIIRMVRDGAIEVASTPIKPIMLEAGKESHIDLGGTGVVVHGMLTPPASHNDKIDWKQGSIRVSVDVPTPAYPQPPEDIQQDQEARSAWWSEWSASDAGKAIIAKKREARAIRDQSISYYATIGKDGELRRLPDVVAGKYEMSIRVGRRTQQSRFQI